MADSGDPGAAPVGALEQALHAARALVLADLATGGVADADVVSMVEDSVAHRRWWVEQWPEGAPYVAGLVAQDVQDALLERYGRWPLCPVCRTHDPHVLDVQPELGPDPHWVCHETGTRVAPVGDLGTVPGHGGPGHGRSGHGQPGHGEPGHGEPGHGGGAPSA